METIDSRFPIWTSGISLSVSTQTITSTLIMFLAISFIFLLLSFVWSPDEMNRGTWLRSWNKPAGKKRSFQFGTDMFLTDKKTSRDFPEGLYSSNILCRKTGCCLRLFQSSILLIQLCSGMSSGFVSALCLATLICRSEIFTATVT